MIKKEIDDNKLIAVFMGGRYKAKTFSLGDRYYDLKDKGLYYFVSELKYNSSWDWLIPVIKKCWKTKELNLTGGWHQADRIEYRINPNDIFGNNIADVYKEVVEFINWYNEQKSK